jgi:hypothetical protein
MSFFAPLSVIIIHPPMIQAACNIITAAIDETAEKEVAIQATQRWIKTSLERAKGGNNPTHCFN